MPMACDRLGSFSFSDLMGEQDVIRGFYVGNEAFLRVTSINTDGSDSISEAKGCGVTSFLAMDCVAAQGNLHWQRTARRPILDASCIPYRLR
jgi:hypothetical protein